MVGLAVALLVSALVTAVPVLTHGHRRPSATAGAVEADTRAQIVLPVGAIGSVGLSVALLGGLLAAPRSRRRGRRPGGRG